MKPLNSEITIGSWSKMPKKQQILNLSAELARVSSAFSRYGNDDPITKEAYERAFELIDLTLKDPRWQDMTMDWRYFRDSMAALYLNKTDPAITNFFSSFLITLSQKIS